MRDNLGEALEIRGRPLVKSEVLWAGAVCFSSGLSIEAWLAGSRQHSSTGKASSNSVGGWGNEESVIIFWLQAGTHARNKHRMTCFQPWLPFSDAYRNTRFQHFEYLMIVTSANSSLSFTFLKTVTEKSLIFSDLMNSLIFFGFVFGAITLLRIGMSVLTWPKKATVSSSTV